MKARFEPAQLKPSHSQPRSPQLVSRFGLSKLLGACLAVASLLVPNPALGRTLPLADADSQLLASSHQANSEALSENGKSALAKRTALFSPEVDKTLANLLLWTVYLGLPLGLVVAIRCHDRRVHQQMVKLIEQVAVLERIWRSQVH